MREVTTCRMIAKTCKQVMRVALSRKQGVRRMNSKDLGLLSVALMAAPIAASAQTETLVYQGNLFSSAGNTVFGTPPPGFNTPFFVSTQDSIIAEITLSSPLGQNLNNAVVVPPNVTIAVVGPDITPIEIANFTNDTNPASFPGYPSFTFSTINGAITGWSFSGALIDIGQGGYHVSVSSTSLGDSYNANTDGLAPRNGGSSGTPGTLSGASNSTPGTWSVAPEIDPASTGSGLTLLLGSLVVMRGRRAAHLRRSETPQPNRR
jgi:hypothetical protein